MNDATLSNTIFLRMQNGGKVSQIFTTRARHGAFPKISNKQNKLKEGGGGGG